MGRFKLSAGFQMIPEGEHVFRIDAVKYDEDFGKMEIRMSTKSGATHIERYSLLNTDGSVKEGAMRAFAFTAQTALNDFSDREIDEQELVGHFIRAEVEHQEGDRTNDRGEKMKFVRLAKKYPATGFEGEEPAPVDPAPVAVNPAPTMNADDLMAMLGSM